MSKSLEIKIWEIKKEIPVMKKKTKGFKFKYTNLIEIESKLKPIMESKNVGYSHRLTHNEEGNILETTIFDIDSTSKQMHTLLIPKNVQLAGMNDYQSLGSAITYFRRYHLIVAFGILTDEDVDAVQPQPQKVTKTDHVVKVKQLIELGRAKSTLERYLQTYSSKMGEDERKTVEDLIKDLKK